MFERYKEDIQCFMEHDPAARSPIEIVLLYPGFKALRSHRIRPGSRFIPAPRSVGGCVLTTAMGL